MILFIILALIALILMTFTIFMISIGGSVFIIIFGDVIVCIWIIMFLIKHIFKRK